VRGPRLARGFTTLILTFRASIRLINEGHAPAVVLNDRRTPRCRTARSFIARLTRSLVETRKHIALRLTDCDDRVRLGSPTPPNVGVSESGYCSGRRCSPADFFEASQIHGYEIRVTHGCPRNTRISIKRLWSGFEFPLPGTEPNRSHFGAERAPPVRSARYGGVPSHYVHSLHGGALG